MLTCSKRHEPEAIAIAQNIVQGVYDDPMGPKEFYQHVWNFYSGNAKASTAKAREVDGARRTFTGVAYAYQERWVSSASPLQILLL